MFVPVDPRIRLTEGAPFSVAARMKADAVAVPASPGKSGPVLGAGASDMAERTGLDIAEVLAKEGAKGETGEVVCVPVPAEEGLVQGLVVGVGDGSSLAYRRAGAALARRVRGHRALVTTVAAEAGEAELAAFVEGVLLASYTFSEASRPKHPSPVEDVEVVVDDPERCRQAFDRAVSVARAVAFARDLVNTPSLTKTPEWLAHQAVAAASRTGVEVRVRAEDELAAEGFGGILAVGMGSVRPPRLIELTYAPEGARRHVVLVGKGITFDSGGLSLKPNDSMKLMKTDMAGGAAVIAVMCALRDLGVRHRVTGLVAAAENLPSASAQRPSDVITHYGGNTVEVLNTDAEGRLVLADALAYADARLAPDALVDLATLTGAASVALGRGHAAHAALYATDDALADALLAAGDASGDRLWRMPLVDDYRDALDSDVADLANIARKEVSAGSIVAALFLREFVGDRRWAHIDIAGPARAASDEHEVTKGGTGFGVRALLRWLAEPAGVLDVFDGGE